VRNFATKESASSSAITIESTLTDPKACKQHDEKVDLRSMSNRFHPHQVAELYLHKHKRKAVKIGYFLNIVKVVKEV
jgi:hypothetical protein